MSSDAIEGGAGQGQPVDGAGDAVAPPVGLVEPVAGEAPDALDLAFADLKAQIRDEIMRLGRLGREVALAAAARIDADAAIAETALASLELDARKKKRRKAQVKRLERLVERTSALLVEPPRGRRRDLRRVAEAVRRIVTTLTEPAE